MEVHLLDRAAVQRRFNLGQPAEDGERPVGHPWRQRGFGDQPDDVRMGAHDGIPIALHRHQGPRARHATSERLLDLELPAGKGEPPQEEPDLFDVRSCIDEGAQGHVAGYPGKAVEPGDRGGGSWRGGQWWRGGRWPAHGSSRAMAQAAP